MVEFNNNWQVKSLGEVAEVIAGQSPPSSTYNDIQDGLPFFQGKVDFGITFPKVRVWCNEPVKIAKPNDVLISVRAPVGPTNICNVKSCIGRGLSAIRSKENSFYKYIFYFLRSIENRISDQGRGSTFNAITQNELRELKIPLPPLPIQKQIAEILEKADQAKQKRKEANKFTDEFLQSVFIEMFGDPVKNPKGWKKVKLGQLSNIRRGASPRPIDKFLDGTVPWIKIGDGTKGSQIYLEETAEKVTEEGARKSVILEEGSLIFANCGVSLGFARILKIKGCIHDGWLSMENISDKLNKIFLLKLINALTYYFQSIAPEGTQPNLNTGIMKNFDVILPPISLQQQFAEIVNKTEALKEKQKQSEQELEHLFQSLMQRAFKGELVS